MSDKELLRKAVRLALHNGPRGWWALWVLPFAVYLVPLSEDATREDIERWRRKAEREALDALCYLLVLAFVLARLIIVVRAG